MDITLSPNILHLLFRFCFYGMICCGAEMFWTIFDFGGAKHGKTYHSVFGRVRHLFRLNPHLEGYTTFPAFLAYGFSMLFAFETIHDAIATWPIFIRGTIYTTCFYIGEFLFVVSYIGMFKAHPWRYDSSWLAPRGMVNFSYAPAWFLLMIIMERIHYFLLQNIKF